MSQHDGTGTLQSGGKQWWKPDAKPSNNVGGQNPPSVDANQSFSFTHDDFVWTYAKRNPPPDVILSDKLKPLATNRYGYNSNNDPTTPQADLLNGGFFNDAFFADGDPGGLSKLVTFHSPGDSASFRFGTGALVEHDRVSAYRNAGGGRLFLSVRSFPPGRAANFR